MESHEPTLIGTVLRAASIWLITLGGFYLFLPTLLGTVSYSRDPLTITLYYLFWLFLTLFEFWPIYRHWKNFRIDGYFYGVLGLGSICILLYLAYILPQFEPVHWSPFWQQPSEILYASSWYFLPKSFDILLQQLLIAALVLAFSREQFALKTIIAWCAALFGGAHLLLILGGNSPAYVASFTLLSIIASFIFPYLILKVRNGLIYSFFIHWSFYAVAVVLLRLLLI